MELRVLPKRTRVVVAICTYKRNEALECLLRSLITCADRLRGRAEIGAVIVDDSSNNEARSVAAQFENLFDLGLTYRVSGRQNISLARNLAIETAMELGDWTAMTDDDCEASPDWIKSLLYVQELTGADAVTGPMVRRVPPGSPRWLTDEPFLELGMERPPDCSELEMASTFNSMVSSAWLKAHPEIRFDPSLGVVGGEDMVFFRAARAAGLKILFSERGFVFENEPPSRATLRYQFRLFFWHGNSSYVSSIANGVRPSRMFVHGVASLLRALGRPVSRLARGQNPQLRYSCATVLHAIGKLVGPLGVRVDHR